jgi:HEAT repeat protein
MTNTVPESQPEDEVQHLIQQLAHGDSGIRAHAAYTLGQRREQAASSALIQLLQDSDWNVVGWAAYALGEIGDPQAVEPLIQLLTRLQVAGSAVEALVKLHDERAVEPLIAFFRRTHIPSVATVLGNWGDKRAVDALIAAMGHPDPHVRFYSVRALGKLGDRRALPILQRAVEADTVPIMDTQSLRGKSVSDVAAKAMKRIEEKQGDETLE